MASIISYLENYIETTIGLPSDLARFLNTIKVLDERAAELLDAIKHTTEALCDLPNVGKSTQQEQEYGELVGIFKRQEAMLYQFNEEKVQLAQHALELIQTHQRELDATHQQFEDEVAAAPLAAQETYNPFEQPYGAQGARGRGKGFEFDSLEPLAAPNMQRSRHQQPPQQQMQQMQQQQQQPMHAAPPPMAGGQAGGGSMGHKKRVRDDPRAMAAAVLAQGDEFAGMAGFGGGGNSNPSSMGQGGEAAPMFPPLTFMNHERTANLLDSAQQPQLPGRLLQVADIKPDLQGRQAEMYWPDDNMWYLIEIHRVNVVDRTATIVYRTGEVEELNLQEIANEGHMSLIEPM